MEILGKEKILSPNECAVIARGEIVESRTFQYDGPLRNDCTQEAFEKKEAKFTPCILYWYT